MTVLADPAAERAVLAAICQKGGEVYLDVADMVRPSSFTVGSNKVLFECLEQVFKHNPDVEIDVATIYSAAKEIGLANVLESKQEVEHLRAIFDFPASEKNARRFAAKIAKLEVTRLLREQLDEAGRKLLEITGEETLSHILGIPEDAIFDFSARLVTRDREPVSINDGIVEYVQLLAENPIDQMGLKTGYDQYDYSIGGGPRGGTVNVIAARPKTGKTVLGGNMAYNIPILNTPCPTLYMDTEMLKKDHVHRTLARLARCNINDIETGKFALKKDVRAKVEAEAEKLEKVLTYDHMQIAGMPFEEQLAVMRRWIVRKVGLNPDGTAKKCCIVYDYLKLMDSAGIINDLKEYQVLGFMMTSLHNFTVRYDIPMIAFMQLNRDGITKETTDTASGSDRIIWLCSNFTIFKKKSDEEIAEDGPKAGNRKLVNIAARHGGGLDDGDYINCHMDGWCADIKEGKTKFELTATKDDTEDQELYHGTDDIPFD